MNGTLRIDLWDVRQGDCTVLRLPTGRLIVIDVGPKGSPLVDWLNERRGSPPEIDAIVLTHNDADHAGALASIIAEHKRRIGAIWMLLDRSATDPKFQKVFRAAEQGEKEGYYSIRQLENGQALWASEDGTYCLRVIHPGFSENTNALIGGQPNAASGLIVLDSGATRFLAWPGDLEIRKVASKLGERSPQVLVGPHHGGPSDYPTKALRKRQPHEAMVNRRREIQSSIASIKPARAFISVGTKNAYHHPRPGYIQRLAGTGTRVVCSQLTNCCERESVRNGAHVLQGSALLGLRPARTGVSCRGSMRLHLAEGELWMDQYDCEHLERVSRLLRPQCLRGTGWRRGDTLPTFRSPDSGYPAQAQSA